MPYLEEIIECNLSRLCRPLRILRFHAHDLNLVPSVTVYRRRGKGPKQRLRFNKTGEPRLEEAYARHFVWPGKHQLHAPLIGKKQSRGADAEQAVEGDPVKERGA